MCFYERNSKPSYSGDVVGWNGNYVGCIEPSGNIVDKRGNHAGRIHPDGYIADMHGNYAGRVEQDGRIVDKHGKHAGRIYNYSVGRNYENGHYDSYGNWQTLPGYCTGRSGIERYVNTAEEANA